MPRGPDHSAPGNTITPGPTDYDEYPMRDSHGENTDFVGLTAIDVPWFYDSENEQFFEGEVDDEDHIVATDEEREHHPEDTVGEAIEKLGDELGWDSLSEWANDHLEHDEES